MSREFYQVRTTGSLHALQKATEPIRDLEKGEVLVSVRAIGLNYADLFAIMGLYSATPKPPFIPGLEFSGIVQESKSSRFKVGEAVIGLTKFGGYATHIVGDPDYLMPLPSGWTFSEGAAFPVQTLTAYYALHILGNLERGQTILIHSAGGGVGLQANRIAKKMDAYTIGVVGNSEKLAILGKEGFDNGILRDNNFSHALKEALGERELNLVLEATGGKYFKQSYDSLAPMGRIVAYGSAQFTPAAHRPNYLTLGLKYLFRPTIDPLSMITANKSVMAFNLIWLYEKRDLLKRLLLEIDQLNLPPPLVGHQFHFANLKAAIEKFKSGSTIGKVIVNV